WNMQVIRVPWPRVPGAPLTLDALSQPGAGSAAWSAISDAVGPAYAAVFNAPMVAAPWALILFVLGSIAIFAATVRRREARAFAVLPLMVVVIPALLACLQPFLGNASQSVVARALAPVEALVMAYGLSVAAGYAEKALERGGVQAALAKRAVFVAPAALILVMIGLQTIAAVREDLAQRKTCEYARDKAKQALRADVLGYGAMVSDEPGWLVFDRKLKVVDLNGALSPYILAGLDERGRPGFQAMAEYVREERPAGMFLWTDRFDALREHVPCEEPFPPGFLEDRPRPAICRFNWSGAPWKNPARAACTRP
ncbi:MAG TPA: hypothetical protein VIH35_05670, partial [Kiritimatiellia bacterium]